MVGVGNGVTASWHERNLIVGIFYNHGCGGGFTDVYTYQSSARDTPKVGVLYYLDIIPQ